MVKSLIWREHTDHKYARRHCFLSHEKEDAENPHPLFQKLYVQWKSSPINDWHMPRAKLHESEQRNRYPYRRRE